MMKRLTLSVRVWRERREGGGPMIMLADRTGEVTKICFAAGLLEVEKTLRSQVCRSFGVLDTGSHLAYNALFVIDSSGVVQANISQSC